jgi:HEAT repeat protein
MDNHSFEIWRLQINKNIPALIKLCTHPVVSTRRRAIVSLRAINATTAIPDLMKLLVIEDDPDIRDIIDATIAHLVSVEKTGVVPERYNRVVRLIGRLATNREEQIIPAIQELGEIGDLMAVEALMLVFGDHSYTHRTRFEAAEALLKLKSPPADVTLLTALRNKNDARLRRKAAAVMGQMNADWATHALIGALNDPEEAVRITARAALEAIGNRDAVEALKNPPTPRKRGRPPKSATNPLKPKTPPPNQTDSADDDESVDKDE